MGLLRQVFPWPDLAVEANNTKYDEYACALTAERLAHEVHGDDNRFLDLAWWAFKEEDERRASIEARAAGVLAATGVVVALLLALAATVPDRREGLPTFLRWALDGLVIAALLSLALSIYFAIEVQRPRTRYTVGPEEVLPHHIRIWANGNRDIAATGELTYTRTAAIKVVEMTAKNYPINHQQNERLMSAQRFARNALVGLVVAVGLLFIAGAPGDDTRPVECNVIFDASGAGVDEVADTLAFAEELCKPD